MVTTVQRLRSSHPEWPTPGRSAPGSRRPGRGTVWAVLAVLLSGFLGGLLTIDVGGAFRQAGAVEEPLVAEPAVIECGLFPSEGQRQSSREIRLSTPAEHGAGVELI